MRKGKAREMKAPWLSRATALSQASWLSPSLQSQPENKQTNKQTEPIFQLPLEPGVDKYQGPGDSEDEAPREAARGQTIRS